MQAQRAGCSQSFHLLTCESALFFLPVSHLTYGCFVPCAGRWPSGDEHVTLMESPLNLNLVPRNLVKWRGQEALGGLSDTWRSGRDRE